MPPTVSIILPARNSGAYLKRCIDSVFLQKHTDWELLLINDGSLDDTREIALSYAEGDKRISVNDSKGSGVSAARNCGLDIASGKYVFFLDSDDRLDPSCLSELVANIEKENADIAQCSFFYSYDTGKNKKDNEAVSAVYAGHDSIMESYFSGMIGRVNIACWGKLYNRDLIDKIRFDEDLSIQEDAFFTFQCCMKASKIVCTEKPLYYYHQNPGSVMNRAFDGSKMQYFTVLDRELDTCGGDGSLAGKIRLRKLTTALDLTGNIVRGNSGTEYLDELRQIALQTSDNIDKHDELGLKTRYKLFLLRNAPNVYYRLLRIRK